MSITGGSISALMGLLLAVAAISPPATGGSAQSTSGSMAPQATSSGGSGDTLPAGSSSSSSGSAGSQATGSGSPGITLTNVQWSSVEADPRAYSGDSVRVLGEIVQVVPNSGGPTVYRAYLDPPTDSEEVAVETTGTSLLPTDTYVSIAGTDQGSAQFTLTLTGNIVTIPLIAANTMTVVTADTVIAPTLATWGPSQPITQNGLTITVTKVELAATETRVFFTATNASNLGVLVSALEATAVQGSNQPSLILSSPDYAGFPQTIEPGVTTTAEVVFGPVSQTGGPLTIRLSNVEDQNFSESWSDYVFSVPPP